MGDQRVGGEFDPAHLREFTTCLLNDIRALEYMLDRGLLETGVRRIGAEQELVIVDKAGQPARKALEILNQLNDSHFTPELATFNLEFNLDPLFFQDDCLSVMEQQIKDLLQKARVVADQLETGLVLTGILPTLRKSDIGLSSMTPKPRYRAINDALTRLRGRDYELFLRGTDELYIKHDSMMLESSNTSFQIHFQVDPEHFVQYYNIAQAVAGPTLAVAVNSPMLFGKRLWHETRIAVFQQSMDTRQPNSYMRETLPRVTFGSSWIRRSALEIFQEDIARYRVLMGVQIDEDPFDVLSRGEVPSLRALTLHNGTVYRWNRPCYGVTNGRPHLRIENRILPAGPTVIDEVANAAFWFGLVAGIADQYQDITEALDFDDAATNFFSAARRGLSSHLNWVGNKVVPAQTLVLEELLPLAKNGLKVSGLKSADIDRYLDVIAERVSRRQTGAQWLLSSHASLKNKGTPSECLGALVAASLQQEKGGQPVHEWSLAVLENSSDLRNHHRLVENFMTTDIFTVYEDDPVELVLSVMHWRRIRHLPVEDNAHNLRGLVDYRSLIKLFHSNTQSNPSSLPVHSIMMTDVPTANPTMPTLSAIALMSQKGATCLPVVREGKLVGIVTQNDFMRIAAQFLEEGLGS